MTEKFDAKIKGRASRRSLLFKKISLLERRGKFEKALFALGQAQGLAPKSSEPEAYNVVEETLREKFGSKEAANVALARGTELGRQQLGKLRKAGAVSKMPLPEEFELGGTYPNPTSGETTIPLDLPEEARVRVAVYDALGRQVRVLANRNFDPGRVEMTFEAGDLASGLYLIRVHVEPTSGAARTFTGKITLVR